MKGVFFCLVMHLHDGWSQCAAWDRGPERIIWAEVERDLPPVGPAAHQQLLPDEPRSSCWRLQTGRSLSVSHVSVPSRPLSEEAPVPSVGLRDNT